jgi:hypothetical protein
MDFQDVFGRLVWCVYRSPGTRQDQIHYHLPGIDPDDGQVHENKQHVDGGIETTFPRFNKQQAAVCGQA